MQAPQTGQLQQPTRPALPQNLLDKAIAYVWPQAAAKRAIARGALALAGGYTGARVDSAALNRYLPLGGSPTTDTIRDLPTLRARSRDQVRNAPVATGALDQTVTNVIGTGLSHNAEVDAEFLGLSATQAAQWQADVDRRWRAWSESVDCDIARKTNFYGLQDLFFRTWLESGDAFCTTPLVQRQPGRPHQLALQLFEADRICNPDRKPNSPTLIDGVEINPDTGEPVAYHIARRHPGDYLPGAANTWQRVAARGTNTGRRNVLHGMRLLRPDQVRGVPWFAPIIEPLKQLSRYTDAELNAAVVSSLFAIFIKMDTQAFQDLFDEDAQGTIVSNASKWSGEVESGKAINLLPGEDVVSSTPGRPNANFDPFWQAIVRQIGMALGLPFEVLVMHFQSSYTAARGALLMAWKFFRGRRDAVVTALCQPVYELWLEHEIANNRIAAPGFFADPLLRAAWSAGVWTGDGPGSVDPSKEVAASKGRVELGISTLQAESILHDGVDWASKHRQRVKEVKAQQRDGIYIAPAGSPAQVPIDPDTDPILAPGDAPPAPSDSSDTNSPESP